MRESQPDSIVAPAEGGVIVSCWVVPGASRTEIKGVHGSAVKIRVAAPPEGGRANAELCRLVSEMLGAPVEIVSGHGSRAKAVFVGGATERAVRAALDRHLS